MKKKTLVIGASLKPERYAYVAIERLTSKGIDVVALGLKKGMVSGVEINTELVAYENIHTVTLYINRERQEAYYDYILALKPKRVLFNPGTENGAFYALLDEHHIFHEEVCTLVMLATNQY